MAGKIRRLKLGVEQKWLGVCSGLAEYFRLDPTVIRLFVLTFTVLTGFIPGLLIYVLAAWVISQA